MSENLTINGKCLCGSVKVTLNDINPEVAACHCNMCRNWGGGPFLALDAGQAIKIDGADSVRIYNSSDWAERAFCGNCGTNLYYRLKSTNSHHVLVGLFDVDQEVALDHEIFVDEKPQYYNFAEDTKKLTGAEVMAMFAGEI